MQRFEAAFSDEQWQMHLAAAERTVAAYGHAWRMIASEVAKGRRLHELDVQGAILDFFRESGLVADHPPIGTSNATNDENRHGATAPGSRVG